MPEDAARAEPVKPVSSVSDLADRMTPVPREGASTAAWGGPEILPRDVPGHMSLNEYSLDAQRSYSFERDRLSREYRQATTDILTNVAAFDTVDGPLRPDVIPALESALSKLPSIAAQLRTLPVPEGNDSMGADHAAFSVALESAAKSIGASLEAAKEHQRTVNDQARRREILRSNKDLGLPFQRGLQEAGLLTWKDVEVLDADDYFAKASPLAKTMETMRLKAEDKRLSERPVFNLGDHMVDGVSKSAPSAARVAAMKEWVRKHG